MSKLTQAVSAVTPLGDALREPAKRRRAPRKPKAEQVVDVTLGCYCGERFTDGDARWKHMFGCEAAKRRILADLRRRDGTRYIAECGTSSGYFRHFKAGEPACEPCLSARAEHVAQGLRENPERLERRRKLSREWERVRRSDPEFLERERERNRERMRQTRARKKAEQAHRIDQKGTK